MRWTRTPRAVALALILMALLAFGAPRAGAQVTLLMEEPYGFFGTVNPTGHTAIYFSRICAETPVQLRRCHADEQGSVIARYQGIDGYDWVAMPLIPYLFSVEDVSDVPQRADKATVQRLRTRYHENHLENLGGNVIEGNFLHGGWGQLAGSSYERKIYALRFDTTEEQDDAVIHRLNWHANRSKFNLLYGNCADFARDILNVYFPHTFHRYVFPDVFMTTPKQLTYTLIHYARKHPELQLSMFTIPQIPGSRRNSHANKTVAGSLMTTAYVVPIAVFNPYLAAGLFVDYLVRGRYPSGLGKPPTLHPDGLWALSSCGSGMENADATKDVAAGDLAHASPPIPVTAKYNSCLRENMSTHE
jgi:hypothetical protein